MSDDKRRDTRDDSRKPASEERSGTFSNDQSKSHGNRPPPTNRGTSKDEG